MSDHFSRWKSTKQPGHCSPLSLSTIITVYGLFEKMIRSAFFPFFKLPKQSSLRSCQAASMVTAFIASWIVTQYSSPYRPCLWDLSVCESPPSWYSQREAEGLERLRGPGEYSNEGQPWLPPRGVSSGLCALVQRYFWCTMYRRSTDGPQRKTKPG